MMFGSGYEFSFTSFLDLTDFKKEIKKREKGRFQTAASEQNFAHNQTHVSR